MVHRGSARRFHSGLDVAQDRQKISVAHELDGAFGCTTNCVFVDRADCRATVRLTDDARVHHAVNLHVVNENAVPENLRGEVEAGAARANGLEIADRLSRGGAGCLDCKIDCASKRPVVLSGRFAVAIDAAVANGEFVGLAGQHFRRLIEKQHLAQSRALFLDQAAKVLACKASELSVRDSNIYRNGKSTGQDYWTLAGAVDLAIKATGAAARKSSAI